MSYYKSLRKVPLIGKLRETPFVSKEASYDHNPSLIIESNGVKIFLGTFEHSKNTNFIAENNIQAIMCVMKEEPFHKNSEFVKNIRFHHIPIDDSVATDISEYFEQSINFIKVNIAQKKNIFVHCQMGISRSASIVIAYLIREHKMTYRAAYDYVKERRGQIEPNFGFSCALMKFK